MLSPDPSLRLRVYTLCQQGIFCVHTVWFLTVGAAAPITITIVLEWKCLSYILPPMAKLIGAYRLCGKVVPFYVYTSFTFTISCLGRLDLITSGIVLAKVLRTCMYPGNLAEPIWASVVATSALPWLPSLLWLAVGSWAVLVMQLVLALLHGLPYKDQGWGGSQNGLKYTVGSLLRSADIPDKYKVQFATAAGGASSIYQATVALAEAARMNAVLFRHGAFYTALKCRYVQYSPGDHSTWARAPWVGEAEKLAGRVVTNFALEVAWQANLQSTILAVSKAANGEPDPEVAFSVCLSCAMGFYNVCKASVYMWTLFTSVWPHMQRDDAEARDGITDAQLRRRLITTSIVFTAAISCTTGLLLYAVVKVRMVYLCERGVWNVSGCVTELPTL